MTADHNMQYVAEQLAAAVNRKRYAMDRLGEKLDSCESLDEAITLFRGTDDDISAALITLRNWVGKDRAKWRNEATWQGTVSRFHAIKQGFGGDAQNSNSAGDAITATESIPF